MTLRNVIGRDRIIFIGTGVTATGFILRSLHPEAAARRPARC